MSLESQYAWAKLAKSVLRTDNVDAQLGDGPAAEIVLGLPRATIDDATRPGGTILLLGADPKETHAALFLRLRHAVVHDGATLVEITPRSTGLAPHAHHSLYPLPGQLGEVIAALEAPVAEVGGVTAAALGATADALAAADDLTVVIGSGSLGDHPDVLTDAVLRVAELYPEATFLPLPHRANVMGALDMGLAPGLLPGRMPLTEEAPGSWDAVPEARGLDTEAMFRLADAGGIDVAILLGCDPLTDFPDATLAERAFNKVEHLVAVDSILNVTSTGADVVFPAAATATEVDGTFTNIEGRLSPINRKVTAPGTARPDWMIAAELAAHLGTDLGFIDLDELWVDLNAASALHAGIDRVALGQPAGVLLVGTSIDAPEPPDIDVPHSSDLRLVVTRKTYDEGTMLTHSPSLAGLAAGATAALNPVLFASLGLAEGDEIKLTSQVGSITAPARADSGVTSGSVAIEFNQPNASAGRLLDFRRPVTTVAVERVS